MSPRPNYVALLLLALVASLVGGCSTIRTSGRPDFDLKNIRSYAWINAPSFTGDVSEHSQESLLAQAQRAIDNYLQQLGARPSTESEAEVLLTATLGIETRRRLNDPDYDLYAVQKDELGSLTITFFDRDQGEAWTGRCRHTLRIASRSERLGRTEFIPTGHARDWRIEQMAERILSRATAQ